MTLDEVKEFMISGRFHHATYRDHGTLWEGIHFYRTETARGSGRTGKNPDLEAVYIMIRNTGYSVGAYGEG